MARTLDCRLDQNFNKHISKKLFTPTFPKTNYLVNNSPFQPNLFEICLTSNITNMCNILFLCPYHSQYLETLALIILFVKMLKILNNLIF